MPVYFAHGFRWPRAGFTGIRVHTIIHNLEDCSAEYIQNPTSQAEILGSFRKAYPDVMRELDGPTGRGLTLLEEYDPEDETSENAVSRPWAFVCDCVRILPTGKNNGGAMSMPRPMSAGRSSTSGQSTMTALKGPALSLNVSELIAEGPGSTAKAWEALADLRDKIANGENIDWWVIYNGDPDRPFDDSGYEDEDDDMVDEEEDSDNELYEDQTPNQSTYVPQQQATRRMQPNATTQVARTTSREVSPSEKMPSRDKGKRVAGMRAFPQQEKLTAPLPPLPPKPAQPAQPASAKPATKSATKSESGLKKKLFGKR